jgi:hypothetical protein
MSSLLRLQVSLSSPPRNTPSQPLAQLDKLRAALSSLLLPVPPPFLQQSELDISFAIAAMTPLAQVQNCIPNLPAAYNGEAPRLFLEDPLHKQIQIYGLSSFNIVPATCFG